MGSTNTYARDLLSLGALGHGDVVQARHQTQGRGRFTNRIWEDTPGGSLLMSLVLTELDHALLPLLPFITGVAVLDALRSHGIQDARLKWPNDVLVGRKKLSGILVESTWSGMEMKGVVIGVGVNVRAQDFTSPIEQKVTSLTSLLGQNVTIDEVRDSLLKNLEPLLNGSIIMEDVLDRTACELEWMRALPPFDVDLLDGEGSSGGLTMRGVLYKGVSQTGALIIESEGTEHTLHAASIRI